MMKHSQGKNQLNIQCHRLRHKYVNEIESEGSEAKEKKRKTERRHRKAE